MRILHGTRDTIVPMWCSECFVKAYDDHSELITVEGENHTISRKLKTLVASVSEFFRKVF
ncbi:MAG: alpha/beta hydrolase [Bacteroidales bacterium]|nr:alpha/beta hydrolase [Bacteroidales bacterium]